MCIVQLFAIRPSQNKDHAAKPARIYLRVIYEPHSNKQKLGLSMGPTQRDDVDLQHGW